MASTSKTTPTVHHGEKPKKFHGTDFKWWQQKMLFYLTTLALAKFLKEDLPTVDEGEQNTQKRVAVDAWNHSDFLCKNYILNGLDNALYNVYCQVKTTKELWESLDKKYRSEDADLKKFIVGRFLDFKMIDSKPIMAQVQELQVILQEIHSEGMNLSDSFQVAPLIEKLPHMWKYFRNYLKHKRKKMNLEDFIVHLRIEEDNRASERKAEKSNFEARETLVEQNSSKKRKHQENAPKKGKNKKFKGNCYNCGKPNHLARDCRGSQKKSSDQVKITEDEKLSNVMTDLMLSAVVFESNLVDNPKEWFTDTRATRHVCVEMEMFSTYTPISGRQLHGSLLRQKSWDLEMWCSR
ncbi:uncharacterized protein [Primulina eburnea]|uniref:uncharacterized protein n=1 Tax=Primulina eburnea TaxID=1245227 RepID=UPI003C6BFA90